jgi:hypothetical protein
MAQIHNISIDQGSPYSQAFLVKNPDNSNKDLTGYSARMHFRTAYSSSTISLDATTANTKLVINIASSTVSINLSATDTASLTYHSYVYDIEIVDGSNIPQRMVQGTVTINPEVTK